MSVINSVLKDLDEKPTAFSPLGVDTRVTRSTANRRWWVKPLLPLGVLLLGGLGWYTWQQGPAQVKLDQAVELSPLQQAAVAAPEIAITPAAPAQSQPPSNQLTGLHIRESERVMELEFQLQREASSYLKQRANNRYVFVIAEVAQAIATPLIDDSPWIEQVSLSRTGDDLEIGFDTKPGILVETSERREGTAYYWLIQLKKPQLVTQPTHQAMSLPVQAANNEPRAVADQASIETVNIDQSSQVPAATAAESVVEVAAKPARVEINPVHQDDPQPALMARALDLMQQGDYPGAANLLDRLIGGELDRDARIQKLAVLQTTGRNQAFAQLLTESLGIYPADPVLRIHQGNQLFAQQRYTDLIRLFGREQQSADLLSLVASSQQRLGDHAAAIQSFKRTLLLNPEQPRMWVSLGISQQNLALSDEALDSYRMSLRSGLQNPRLRQFVDNKIRQLSQ